MRGSFLIALLFTGLLIAYNYALAQDQKTTRTYTRADFINVDGGGLNDRIERAIKQFKSSNAGDSFWIAYHFPALDGVSYGPFSGSIYYDEGIKLEHRDDPSTAAVFLLTDATGSQPKFKSVKTLNLSEQYVFENRPVYWLGNVDGGQSVTLLEQTMNADPGNINLARGIMRALAVHNNPGIVPMLKNTAAKENSIDLQRSAISNLSRVRTSESLDALIDLYEKSTVVSLKEEIISGIARIDTRKATEKLLAIAQNDPNPKLRQRAIRRLSSQRGTGIWFN
jgi:hypothetical protein